MFKLTDEQMCSMEEAVRVRFHASERRLRHVLSVADTAELLAEHYQYDGCKARVAGLLHDWDKLLSLSELHQLVERYQISYVGELSNISPLLHAWTAAFSVKEAFEYLDQEICDAIFHHTVGTAKPTKLDMIVFVADCLEPTRNSIVFSELYELIGEVSLECLYIQCLKRGMIYILEQGKRLYPPALEYYNELATLYPRESGDLGLGCMGKKSEKSKDQKKSKDLLKELRKEYKKGCLKKIAKKEALSKKERSKACKICKGC